MKKTTLLRKYLAEETCLVQPDAADALSALIIQQAGFKVIGTSSFCFHASLLGTTDIGLMTLTEVLDITRNICDAVDIPVIGDAEAGYGNAINTIRTIRSFEQAGMAGLFIEDQQLPPNCPSIKETKLISKDEMLGKIKAALDAREDPDFLFIARTDAPFEEAVERANAYLEAGADMVKVIPKTREELERMPKLINGPLQVAFSASPSRNDGMTIQDVCNLGYKIVSVPIPGLGARCKAELELWKEVAKLGDWESFSNLVMSRKDIKKLVNDDKFKSFDNKYLLN